MMRIINHETGHSPLCSFSGLSDAGPGALWEKAFAGKTRRRNFSDRRVFAGLVRVNLARPDQSAAIRTVTQRDLSASIAPLKRKVAHLAN
jgi:hypothetical protein